MSAIGISLICWAFFITLVYLYMAYEHFLSDAKLGEKFHNMLIENEEENDDEEEEE